MARHDMCLGEFMKGDLVNEQTGRFEFERKTINV